MIDLIGRISALLFAIRGAGRGFAGVPSIGIMVLWKFAEEHIVRSWAAIIAYCKILA